MVPDAEILAMLCDALTALDIGAYTVKVNHRKILDGIFELAGVPADKTRSISSAVDKLDKAPWSEVKKEMTVEKGLSEEIADKIGKYVGLKGGSDSRRSILTLQVKDSNYWRSWKEMPSSTPLHLPRLVSRICDCSSSTCRSTRFSTR